MAFNKDMTKLATGNAFFQKEAYRDRNAQIVLMSLEPGEDIGEETHPAPIRPPISSTAPGRRWWTAARCA
jgi:quercetin dioxygenase-like cupin family protein